MIPFSLNLPQEPPAVIEFNRPPAYWPSSTSDSLVTVENLVVKYAPDLPAVLHDVSFSLKAGERIGLLGRTGSGKSTLAMSILRFVDPVEGRILIDGIDISTIGVHDLRSRLTFIPQVRGQVSVCWPFLSIHRMLRSSLVHCERIWIPSVRHQLKGLMRKITDWNNN
jgi:ABC-type Mn2+/Zn2+ transport system ATPase subunit